MERWESVFADDETDFFDDLDFRGLNVDEAIFYLLSEFRPPPSRPAFEGFLTLLSNRYSAQCGDGALADEETVYVLAHSVMLLSAAAHAAPRVPLTLTKEVWIDSIAQTVSVPPELYAVLEGMYDRVLRRPPVSLLRLPSALSQQRRRSCCWRLCL